MKAVNYQDMHALPEYNAVLNIAMFDLEVITRHIVISNNDWEKMYYAKYSYTLIYETIERYNKQIKHTER